MASRWWKKEPARVHPTAHIKVYDRDGAFLFRMKVAKNWPAKGIVQYRGFPVAVDKTCMPFRFTIHDKMIPATIPGDVENPTPLLVGDTFALRVRLTADYIKRAIENA